MHVDTRGGGGVKRAERNSGRETEERENAPDNRARRKTQQAVGEPAEREKSRRFSALPALVAAGLPVYSFGPSPTPSSSTSDFGLARTLSLPRENWVAVRVAPRRAALKLG